MDSTISVQPGEAPDSLHQPGGRPGVVLPARWSTGTIFFSMALPPRWCSTANFSRKSARRWERLPPLPPSALGFFSPARRNYFWPLRRSPRAETDADDDRLDDGYRHCLHRPAPSFNQIGWWAPVLLVFLRAVQDSPSAANGAARRCSRWRMPHRGKSLYSSGCRWATASASCSLPGWYR